jgi:hypothetical protein
VAIDRAGNIEAAPSTPDSTTLVDTQTPISSASSPQFSDSATFTVSYNASDPGSSPSGLAEVDIYAKGPSDSTFNLAHAFTSGTLTSGSFTYSATEGDVNYSFYSVAIDKAGNVEAAPTTPDSTTLVDTQAPTSSTSSPQLSNSTAFTVSYTANDPGSTTSGLAEVDVYLKGPSDSAYSLAHTFTSGTFTSGSFSFNAAEGDGNYSFYSLATDKAGNAEAAPSTPDTTTLVDTTNPTSSASSPQFSNSTTFTVGYTASDPGSSPSGLAEVDIYARGPSDSAFSLVHAFTTGSLTGGSFSYTATEGDGNYSFYSVATDRAGNVEAVPTTPDSTTPVDTQAPTSSASSPQFSNSTSFTVSYTASDPGSNASGLAQVDIYAKGPSDSAYSLAHTFTTGTLSSGSFSYPAGEGDGSYSFYSVATDKAGNVEAVPSTPDTTTLVDTVKPTSSVTPLPTLNSATFIVGFTASDLGSNASGLAEVDVYVKGPSDSAYSLAHAFTTGTLTGGSFSYSTAEGSGTYSFYSVAKDRAGNVEAAPAAAQASTTLPSAPPPGPTPSPVRGITAQLVNVKVNKKKERLDVVVSFADTGAKKSEFPSPFQKTKYKNIQVSVRDSNGDGVPDLVVLTAKKGKKSVTATFPG